MTYAWFETNAVVNTFPRNGYVNVERVCKNSDCAPGLAVALDC